MQANPPILGTHFNAAGLRQLGQRYATKYLEMTSASSEPPKLPTDVIAPETVDTEASTVTLSNPSVNNAIIPPSPQFNGTVTDTGGSGVDRVAIYLWDKTLQSYIDPNGNATGHIAHDANIPAGNPSAADWTLDSTLSPGNYWMGVYPYDAAGNFDAANIISRHFSIE